MGEEPMLYSSFKTIDARDYSPIATIDVKRCIFGVCANKYDTQIAVVENAREYSSPNESIVRLYDVGRLRDDEDIGTEADDDDEEDEDESDNFRNDLLLGGTVDEDGNIIADDTSNSDDDDDDNNSYIGSQNDSDFDEELFTVNAEDSSNS